MNPFDLKGKIALVTGASYGIGYAIATGLAGAGAKIVFNDINQDLVDKGIAAYKADGIEAKGYVCDVTNEDQVNEMVATIEKEVGTIDVLVNNAGIIKRIPMHEMSAAEFRQVIDIDLNGPFIVAKAVIPSMMKKRSGKIINICSLFSYLGGQWSPAYASSKHGIAGLTKAFCDELAQFNIQVNGIAPGYYATILTEKTRSNPETNNRVLSHIPSNRWGELQFARTTKLLYSIKFILIPAFRIISYIV